MRARSFRRALELSVSGLALHLLVTTPAFAQSTEADPPSSEQSAKAESDAAGNGEIVVTARYRTENLQDTPIAITAITAEDLTKRAISSAYEIGYTVPNAALRPAQAQSGPVMTAYIRGIGQYDALAEFEPGVAIYVDDAYHATTVGSMIELLDLERVEVLRGPQGTLFGRGSIGGAIRYVTKKPTGDNSGYVEATGGSYNRIDIRGSYDFGLTDNLFARVSAMSKHRDGFQQVIDYACAFPATAGTIPARVTREDCRLGTQGGESVNGARAAVRWLPSSDLEFNVSGEYINDTSEAAADSIVGIARVNGNLPPPFNAWSNALEARYGVPYDERFIPPNIYTTYSTFSDPVSGLEFDPRRAIKQIDLTGKMDWNVSDDVKAEVIVARREYNGHYSSDTDGSPYSLQTLRGNQRFHSFQLEARLSGTLWDRLEWTLGGFHYAGQFKFRLISSIPAYIPNYPDRVVFIDQNTTTDSENNSAFLHTILEVTDTLSVSGGLRYSRDNKKEQFDNSIVRAAIDTTNSNVDWKLGIDYKATPDLLLYASAATGYRPQAFNPRPFQPTQFTSVKGESATSYEAGIKATLIDRILQTNLAAFYIDYSSRIVRGGGIECLTDAEGNYLALVPPGTPGSVTDTVGNTCVTPPGFNSPTTGFGRLLSSTAKIKGVEAEVRLTPVEGMIISGAFGYLDWKSADLEGPTILADYPVYVPKLNWSLSASYEVPIGKSGSLTPRADVYSQSRICTSITTTASIYPFAGCSDGYTIANARLEWNNAGHDFTIALGVTNLFKKEYYLNTFDTTEFNQPPVIAQPGRPREWYLSMRKSF